MRDLCHEKFALCKVCIMMIAIMRGAAPSATVGQSIGIVLTTGSEGGQTIECYVLNSDKYQIQTKPQSTNTDY